MNQTNFDVLVVGGGMVGASMALALGQAGWQVALIEDQPVPNLPALDSPFDLRVSALSPTSMEFLVSLGVWPRIRQTRMAPYRRMRVWDEAGSGDVTFDCADIGLPALGHIVENSLIQAALWAKIAEVDTITCLRDTRPVELVVDASSAQLTLNSGETVTGALVIGADGGQSWVRQTAGIEETSLDYHTGAQVFSVTTEYPQQDITWQRFTAQGPQAFLPLTGHHASLVWYDDLGAVKMRHAWSDTELLDHLHAEFPPELGRIVRIDQRGYFPIRRMHAQRYQSDRVVLVGDAAHTIHPLAGQGVNLGFYDAMALLDCLADSDDLGARKPLQRYERLRRADNLMTQSGMDVFHYGFRVQNPALIQLRNLGLSAVAHIPPLRKRVSQAASGQR